MWSESSFFFFFFYWFFFFLFFLFFFFSFPLFEGVSWIPFITFFLGVS
jgi:hypothetical protein